MTIEIIRKTFRAEVKGFDEKTGEVEMFIPVSTNSVDRDEEVVEPFAFKKTLPKFMKRPVLVCSHDYGYLTSQIGEWIKLKIGDIGMDGRPKYYINEGNEQADWGFKLATKGMAAYSIGFIPKAWVDGDGIKSPRRTYTEVELLEISQVVVPSNRDAIQGVRGKSVDSVVNQLVEDIVNAEIVDMTEEKETITKPEETDEYIRIPVDRGDHEGHRIRTIEISAKEGISAIYCGTDKVIMTYLFAKDKGWDMEKARAWVKDHEGKSLAELHEHKTSQKEIEDEIDFIKLLISENGMSDATKSMAWELVREIMRLTGNDMPDDIKALIKSEPTQSDLLEAIKRIAERKLTEVK